MGCLEGCECLFVEVTMMVECHSQLMGGSQGCPTTCSIRQRSLHDEASSAPKANHSSGVKHGGRIQRRTWTSPGDGICHEDSVFDGKLRPGNVQVMTVGFFKLLSTLSSSLSF